MMWRRTPVSWTDRSRPKGNMMRKLVIMAIAVFVMAASPTKVFSQHLQELLKKQEIIGDFGNWMVSKGQTASEEKYCAATSLTLSNGGRISLRVLANSRDRLEWQVFPSTTAFGEGLSEIEAKKLLLADFAPSFVTRAGEPTIQAMVSIGMQPLFPVQFTTVRVGAIITLRKQESTSGARPNTERRCRRKRPDSYQ